MTTKQFLGLSNQFNDINQLEVSILNFDKHKPTPILYMDSQNNEVETKDFKGILNTTLNRLESVMTKKYNLIEHSKAIIPLVDILKKLNLTNVNGYTFCNGKKAYCMVWFNDTNTQIEVEKGDIIKLGVLITNSVDGTRALTSEIIGLRLVCLNGMTTKELIAGFRKIHLGETEDLTQLVKDFYQETIINIGKYNDTLRDIISRSIGEYLKQEVLEYILNGIGLPNKHIEKLLEKLKEFDKITKWGLYNQITEYITYLVGKASLERRLAFLKFANKMLIIETDKLIEMGRKSIAEQKTLKEVVV